MAPSRISPPASDPFTPIKINDTQLASYNADGYVIIPNALSPATVNALLSETNAMLSSFSLNDHPMTKFSTGESASHVGDDYFLTSGDKVRFFFEEDAFSPSTGELTTPKERAINKIGHYLHELSPPFKEITFTPIHRAIAKAIGFRDPRVLQSMIICKQPEIGGRVLPHQDSTFLYTNPPSAVGFWIALEDATKENGCLSFAKGSHRRTPVKSRLIRKTEGGTGFEDIQGAHFPKDFQIEDHDPALDEDYELGEVKAGTLVLIHGNLLHKSEKNLSGKSRFIYTFHCIEGDNEYDEKNPEKPGNPLPASFPSQITNQTDLTSRAYLMTLLTDCELRAEKLYNLDRKFVKVYSDTSGCGCTTRSHVQITPPGSKPLYYHIQEDQKYGSIAESLEALLRTLIEKAAEGEGDEPFDDDGFRDYLGKLRKIRDELKENGKVCDITYRD